jgi:hypothetical protein
LKPPARCLGDLVPAVVVDPLGQVAVAVGDRVEDLDLVDGHQLVGPRDLGRGAAAVRLDDRAVQRGELVEVLSDAVDQLRFRGGDACAAKRLQLLAERGCRGEERGARLGGVGGGAVDPRTMSNAYAVCQPLKSAHRNLTCLASWLAVE